MSHYARIFLIALVAVSAISPAFAAKKSPSSAALRSALLPGLGQFYTSQDQLGWLVLGVFSTSLVTAIAMTPATFEDTGSNTSDSQFDFGGDEAKSQNEAIVYGMYGVAAATWVFGVLNARLAAKRINEGRPLYSLGFWTDTEAQGVGFRITLHR